MMGKSMLKGIINGIHLGVSILSSPFEATLAEVINALLMLCLAFVFFNAFWQRRLSKLASAGVIAACFGIVMTALIVFKGRAFSYIMLFSAFLLLSVIFDSHWMHKVLSTGIYTVLLFVTEMIVRVAMTALFGISSGESYSGEYYFSAFLMSRVLMLLVIYLIRTLKHKPFVSELEGKYLRVISFPISSALVIVMQHTLLLSGRYWRPTVYYFALVIDIALFVSNMVVFDYIDSLYDNAMHKSKIEHANKLMEMQAVQYKAMVENNYKINKTKHDFKNFCIGLVSELRAGRTESVIEKLCDVYEETSLIKSDTGNIIETLLAIKAEEAKKKGVDIHRECHNLSELWFTDVDLAIILGNAIDNAVEATAQTENARVVDIFVTVKNNIIVITIKNPVKSNIDVNCLGHTKPDKSNHGFGIISMKQLVDKYDGELIFTCEDLCFTTSIVMSNLPASFCGGEV